MAESPEGHVSAEVRRQYEEFPYPARDASDGVSYTPLDDLNVINHHCFAGRRDFQDGFRVLVAGGGTGDATIFYAHQLRNTNARIVHLDFSQSAIDVARERLQQAGLDKNVEWYCGSLTALPSVAIPKFDLINCVGVLHHLPDPEAGLQALSAVLKDDGALALMLYGKYGRTAIYQMQELLRHVNSNVDDPQARLTNAKRVLASLPETNWYQRTRDLFLATEQSSDSELVDLFLHPQDRAYSIPDVYELLDSCGLNLVDFLWAFRPFYESLSGTPLAELVADLPPRERHAAAEIYWGSISQHTFWASRHASPQANLDDLDNVPLFAQTVPSLSDIRKKILAHQGSAFPIRVTNKGVNFDVTLEMTPVVRRFVSLIDAERTLGKIIDIIHDEQVGNLSMDEIRRECRTAIETLGAFDLLVVRHVSVPALKSGPATDHADAA